MARTMPDRHGGASGRRPAWRLARQNRLCLFAHCGVCLRLASILLRVRAHRCRGARVRVRAPLSGTRICALRDVSASDKHGGIWVTYSVANGAEAQLFRWLLAGERNATWWYRWPLLFRVCVSPNIWRAVLPPPRITRIARRTHSLHMHCHLAAHAGIMLSWLLCGAALSALSLGDQTRRLSDGFLVGEWRGRFCLVAMNALFRRAKRQYITALANRHQQTSEWRRLGSMAASRHCGVSIADGGRWWEDGTLSTKRVMCSFELRTPFTFSFWNITDCSSVCLIYHYYTQPSGLPRYALTIPSPPSCLGGAMLFFYHVLLLPSHC